jgi:tetratricopeptide (TPR) repeat protein
MHLTPNLIAAVSRGELPRRVLVEIGKDHLAAVCPICAEAMATAEVVLRRDRGESPATYDRAVEAARRRLDDRERQVWEDTREARAWVREIVRLGPGKRNGRVAGAYKRFRGRVFGLLLLDEARAAIPEEPAESASLAEAALVSCERTAPHAPDPEVKVPALAVLGNAKRAMGLLKEADEDLRAARRLLETSDVRDVTVAAELDRYEGSLRKDQGRLDEAARYVARAAALYRFVGEIENAARALIKLGTIHHRRHDHVAALDAAEKATKLLGVVEPPSQTLLASARYNVAYYLHASGDLDRAEAELNAHAELLADAGYWIALHVVWLRARIAWSREDLATAERLFLEARERSVARGVAFDTSLISLELALVHLVRGRTREAERLATEALAVFAEQEVERETLAALEVVEAAVRREALTSELVEHAVSELREAPGRRGARGRTS